MKNLVTRDDSGKFGVEGVDLSKLPQKLYMCIVKLKDYEALGLLPDEVEQLIYENKDLKATLDKKEAAPADTGTDRNEKVELKIDLDRMNKSMLNG